MHLRSPVDPGDCRPDRRFGFAEDKRDSVDKSHEVEALFWPQIERDLIRSDIAILRGIIEVNQANGDVLAVGAEGHCLLASEPRHELLVCCNETVTNHTLNDGTEFVDNFLRTCWLLGNLWIQPHQS